MAGTNERKYSSPAPQLKRGLVVYKDKAANFPGRREFFEYKDFGVSDATSGFLKVYHIKAKGQEKNYTGWHYHDCDWQWSYIVNGFIDVLWEDGTSEKLTAGCSIFIPGGVKHNETNVSDDLEVLEMSCPAKMGTYPCEAPVTLEKKSA